MRFKGTPRRVSAVIGGFCALLLMAGAASAGTGTLSDLRAGLASLSDEKQAASITLSDSTSSLALGPGTSGTVTITVASTGLNGPINLSVASALPTGVTAVLSQVNIKGAGTTTLRLSVGASASPGTTAILVSATSGRVSTSTHITLAETNNLAGFTMALATPITGLMPGDSSPIDIAFTNPNPLPLHLTALSLALTAVVRSPGATLPCGLSDYSVSQFAGALPLTLPAKATARLSALVPNSAAWPRLAMINLPTSQDGCRGATVSFSFTGSAHT